MTIIGCGNYTYEHVENWADVPARMSFKSVNAVATHFQDRDQVRSLA